MMVLLILLALALLAATVWFLHRQQQAALTEVAEREQALPSLSDSQAATTSLPSSNQSIPQSETKPEAGQESAPEHQSTSPSDMEQSQHTTEANIKIAATLSTESPGEAWKSLSAQARERADYVEAIDICMTVWPQMQAYQQAALAARAALRDKSIGRDSINSWLEILYQLAVEASFLHDKVTGTPDLKWQALASRFRREEIAALPADWQQLGYSELKLLNRTDIKLLVQHWGEPAHHQSARHLYRQIFISPSVY